MNNRPASLFPRLLPPLAALAAGGLTVFAFAPFGLWPLQILTLALVFMLALRSSGFAQSALIGWAYSSGILIAGVHWLYISMHRYGGMPGWMAALAVVLLSVALSAYAALGFGLAGWLRRRASLGASATTVSALLLLPAVWTLAEWLRGWIFTGFPWVSAGYAHTSGPLAGYAPVVGVYGLALISGVIAGCIALLPKSTGIGRHALPVGLALAILAGGLILKQIRWTTPHGAPISVRLLQGNVPQEMKFAPEQLQASLALYHASITRRPADLIATPETAIPLLSTQLPPDYLGLLSKFAQDSGSHIALGIPVSDGPRQYANSVLGLVPNPAAQAYRYDKHHLVPFGEFIPPGFRWFVEMMHIPLGDFNRGILLQKPFAVKDQWVMPNICYEDLFGEEIAAQLSAGATSGMPQATILLNMSNIAWFGDSIALPQHLQISQLRAMETGRPMLRATNTGATAHVGPDGAVIAQLEPFTQGELETKVQGYAGLTPYSRLGNVPAVIAALLALGVAAARLRKGGKNAPHAGKTR
ncbi:apolipoprotein N-acyltransferase [Noviherbaspirillum sp. CPCC 100848]|uniref:Apolipoprotein N-acyltransferase n=1 Tax=Noviherbaspirillum album TaxID=3080276 RepID=A0ABU6J9K5_9BURK|nr:apolipoprotein N-acyltransferase [Noviherbaspirillum sp. CPCC 100848]MEC4720195.1 apolipoprotein N-acyltransferase [Noviherbaspirillum sp. CPCC 100848]